MNRLSAIEKHLGPEETYIQPELLMQDMHLLAEREILSKLKARGLLKGSVEEMVDYRIGALFMPHGEPFKQWGIH